VRIKAGGNLEDSVSGVGARSVMVWGINTDLVEVVEVILTSGASASLYTTNSFWRAYRAAAREVGLYNGANVGDIVIENADDMLTIAAGEGQTQHGAYTVPSGQTAQIIGVYINVDSNKSADVRLMARLNMTDTSVPVFGKQLITYWDGVMGYIAHAEATPSIPALTDIWMEAKGGSAATAVSVGFDLLLKDDDPGHLKRL
jgi:hypothetical protein